MSSALRTGTYVLVAAIALFELAVVWLMFHPNVPPDFRAFYIDKTTTCLNQPVSGSYKLGATIDFTPPGAAGAKPVRVCGWEGPAGDGIHAIGTSARLRFVYSEPEIPTQLKLTMVAVKKDTQPTQRVGIVINGELVDTITVAVDPPQDFVVAIPAATASSANGRIELELRLLDAVAMGKSDPDNRRRSIKLLSATLLPA